MPKLSAQDQSAIRRILGLRAGQPMALCPARDRRVAKILSFKGNPEHMERGHVCSACRCQRIAGSGTKGDFYGLGEQTGHFGVGYCRFHEGLLHKGHAEKIAMDQMRAMQTVGMNESRMPAVEIQEANLVKASMEMSDGIALVQRTLNEFQDRVIKGEFTESTKSGPMPASDKTRVELACRLADTIAKITKEDWAIRSNEYIHFNELKSRLPLMISMTFRFITDEQQRQSWLREFTDLWKAVKTGSQT